MITVGTVAINPSTTAAWVVVSSTINPPGGTSNNYKTSGYTSTLYKFSGTYAPLVPGNSGPASITYTAGKFASALISAVLTAIGQTSIFSNLKVASSTINMRGGTSDNYTSSGYTSTLYKIAGTPLITPLAATGTNVTYTVGKYADSWTPNVLGSSGTATGSGAFSAFKVASTTTSTKAGSSNLTITGSYAPTVWYGPVNIKYIFWS